MLLLAFLLTIFRAAASQLIPTTPGRLSLIARSSLRGLALQLLLVVRAGGSLRGLTLLLLLLLLAVELEVVCVD
ncbi:hypothetical protein P3T76_013724 [Phytophthora citrophthora]|uniref:Uncharacterized protein n=1 Tax=Phytophthora citrophthora TaxID=4793 RepID=A0AAD9G2H2_9STRA|nr:hypothetical protein P3T76_013724 [Phytophthora citrophthora]